MMQRRALICTKNRYLARKLALELDPLSFEVLITDTLPKGNGETGDLLLIDCDTVKADAYPQEALLFSKDENAQKGVICLPLPLGALRSLADRDTSSRMSLNKEARTVTLFGVTVKLTGIEFSMLERLVSGGGGFVSKEELRKTLFDKDATPGAVSVYIHYLRQKLEFRGEKVIRSSRGVGYTIAEKYLPKEEGVC